MDIKIKKYLADILMAAEDIQSFTAHKTQADYEQDKMLKAAVERKFEIMGEALNRISKQDKSVAESFPNFRQIISFRNILIHSYDSIDDMIVWDVSQQNLETLIIQIKQLLESET